MTVYPFAIDDDTTIVRVDDNISEVGEESINQLRDAVFAIETELGTDPSGSLETVADRLNVSLNPNGTIRASALASVGLATLPIDNAQVGIHAGIVESKLTLDHSTSDLYTLIAANSALLNSLITFANTTFSDLNAHITGAQFLTDGSPARHVASQIDLNAVPSDPRDPLYVWNGIRDKFGTLRPGTQAAQALDEINSALVGHELSIANAHFASAIMVDTSGFAEIPISANDAQKAFQAIDDFELFNIGIHRATKHANAVPRIGRVQSFTLPDGYKEQVVPPTPVNTFLVHPPNNRPVDNNALGDDIVEFKPDNTGFVFDSQFSQAKPGDHIRINYGNGIEAIYYIDSIRYEPGSTWVVRLNGYNLFDVDGADGYDGYARIDRPLYDVDTAGVLAIASANATRPAPPIAFTDVVASVIAGHPRGAMALGLGFDAGQLDDEHYNLYLELYPTGNPNDHVISLPAIDVTGNAGITPGDYTLDTVVQATNNKLREIGYNYRFIAFAYEGEFGIMLADAIGGASFAIIKGVNNAGTLITDIYTENVIGESAGDDYDVFGFGAAHIDIASPTFLATFPDQWSAQMPTKVIMPFKERHYVVNGRKLDRFAPTYNAQVDIHGDGYWDGYISNRNPIVPFTVETTYLVNLDLRAAELKPGKTIVIQPAIPFSDPFYYDLDYGRFVIKDVTFIQCPGDPAYTLITVYNSRHGTGSGFGFSSEPPLPVKLYFSEDSISFNDAHVINAAPVGDYHRLHEIYVTDEGKTFSHERARMLHQEEDTPYANALATSNWHIENVSPKLRAYRDGATTFNRYIRFYINTYTVASGEYDGYIGQRDPFGDGIFNVGPLTTGRKDVPTRFYDETYNDYIDLVFLDLTAAFPGDPILGSAVPRYVDIEIFPSLRLQDELMILATCEVNWRPDSDTYIVERAQDRRQFGSVDETDFTTSAIEFITSGDRHLHPNGVLRGLDLDYIATTPSGTSEVFFKGGLALVNGHISVINNMSATIPEIFPAGTPYPPPPPISVLWAVCANEHNGLETILITTTKTQYFAETPAGQTYYVPSVTFTELINTRQDLTPIALIVADISSVNITEGDVEDVRKFVDHEGANHPLTWTTEDFVGNFHCVEALKNWINRYDVGQFGVNDSTGGVQKVRVRGVWDVDSTIDLSGFTIPVVFEGDGAVFNVTVPQGFIIDSFVSLYGINFVYNPEGSYTPDDKINIGNGCIYREPQSGANGLSHMMRIERCIFVSEVTSQRPPFINFELNRDDWVSNVRVTDNQFNDADDATAKIQAAIVFVNVDGAGSGPSVLHNTWIENNRCNFAQGIYVISPTDFVGGVITGYGLRTANVNICKNHCGVIGFLTSGVEAASATLLSGVDFTNGLNISENTCHYIASLDTLGDSIFGLGDSAYTSGNVVIDKNNCNWIFAKIQQTAATTASSVQITNNTLRAYNTTYLEDTFWYGSSIVLRAENSAIFVSDYMSTEESIREIIGNNIDQDVVDGVTYQYNNGISASGPSLITNNIIKNFVLDGATASSGYGIFLDDIGPATEDMKVVTNNKIYRGTNDIYAYITGGGWVDHALVVDNYFDNYFVAASAPPVDTDVIKNRGDNWVVERNINQTETIHVHGHEGTWASSEIGAGDGFAFFFGDTNAPDPASNPDITGVAAVMSIGNSPDMFREVFFIVYDRSITTDARFMHYYIDLESYLPKNTYFVQAETRMTVSDDFDTLDYILAVMTHNGPGVPQAGAPTDISSAGTYDITTTAPDSSFRTGVGKSIALLLYWELESAASGDTKKFVAVGDHTIQKAVDITYRW